MVQSGCTDLPPAYLTGLFVELHAATFDLAGAAVDKEEAAKAHSRGESGESKPPFDRSSSLPKIKAIGAMVDSPESIGLLCQLGYLLPPRAMSRAIKVSTAAPQRERQACLALQRVMP